jgi:hypothetical protein
MRFTETLKFRNFRIVFVSQGSESEHDQAEVLIAVHGMVARCTSRNLARRPIVVCKGGRCKDFILVDGAMDTRTCLLTARKEPMARPLLDGRLVKRKLPLYVEFFRSPLIALSLKRITKTLNGRLFLHHKTSKEARCDMVPQCDSGDAAE